MAFRYLSSISGSDANTGLDSWANAKATLVSAAAGVAAGDVIYVAGGHAEVFTSSMSINFGGTALAPVTLIGASDSASPPTAEAGTASIAGSSAILAVTFNGHLHAKGITFRNGGTGSGSFNLNQLDGVQTYENCRLEMGTNHPSAKFFVGIANTSASAETNFKNTWYKAAAVSQSLYILHKFRAVGGGIASDSAQLTSLVWGVQPGTIDAVFDSFDMTALASTLNLVSSSADQSGSVTFRGCQMPVGWTGLPLAGVATNGLRVEVINCWSGANKISAWAQSGSGQCRSVSTTYRTGGALDDVTPLTMRLSTVAGLVSPSAAMAGVPCSAFVASSGVPVTRYLEIVHDSQGSGAGGALTNAEFGASVVYSGGSMDVVRADLLSTPTDIATSSATWTTPGMTAPVRQRLAITFTPANKGEVIVTPLLMAAGKQVFYCPKLES